MKIRPYRSPLQLLIIMGVSIYVVEFMVMIILVFLPHESPVVHAFVDSSILIVLLVPFLYLFLFRPLILHIKETKKVEEDLTRERDRAQRYLDVARVMLIVLDTDGKVALINRRGCEILGYDEAEILGKDWFENFIPVEMRGGVKRVFRELIQKGVDREGYFENPVLTRRGEERIILWHNTVLREDGQVAGTLSSGEDVTERKRAEDSLKESETRYRLIHDTAFDAIIIADEEDLVVECNPSAEKMFGYGRGELVGVNIIDLMPEEYRGKHLEGLRRFLSTGESRIQDKVIEIEGLRRDGEVFPVELIVSNFKLGERVYFSGTIRDITERKRAEEEKDVIQAQLNQAQKMEAIGRLGGGIAHDFNNILTAIRGNAELAMELVDREDPVRSNLEEVILSVAHASKLTRQLLLFSRGHPFELTTLDLNATVENLLKMLKRLIGEDIEVVTELDSGLWTVRADESNMEQVLLNLAVNARDSMPDGGTLLIKTGNAIMTDEDCKKIPECRPGTSVCLTVVDTGVGMDKLVLSRIFEPFFTTKETGKGTGLGLSVVYGIVRQHDGWIDVKSQPGKGTTFRIYLPAEPVEATKKAVEEAPPVLKPSGGGGGGGKEGRGEMGGKGGK
ncbi:MAG TPA: PAS domain S-box protein, partial [Thermodesulfobacteriota bacterium]|nr:PAS domain S-box protein [Thermodesulfobacteriota bacterium]